MRLLFYILLVHFPFHFFVAVVARVAILPLCFLLFSVDLFIDFFARRLLFFHIHLFVGGVFFLFSCCCC